MMRCLDTVLRELPIGPGKKGRKPIYERGNGIWAHQLEAATVGLRPFKKIRTDPPLQALVDAAGSGTCSVWEIGAHTRAEESEVLMPLYPRCHYHAYEPVPAYYQQLEQKWNAYNAGRASGQPEMTTHPYGLSNREYSFAVADDQLQGIATYFSDNEHVDSSNNKGGGATTQQNNANDKNVQYAQIKTFATAVADANNQPPTMLEINCEGCEWEMIPAMVEVGFVQNVPIIVLGTHNYGSVGVGMRSMELCLMRYALSKTHDLIEGSRAFAWERWELRR